MLLPDFVKLYEVMYDIDGLEHQLRSSSSAVLLPVVFVWCDF